MSVMGSPQIVGHEPQNNEKSKSGSEKGERRAWLKGEQQG
jgi:hypothetical protein